MTRYAEQTSVSAERSRSEIESTLRRYGADGFMYAWQDEKALVQFTYQGWRVRFVLTMPARDEREFTHTPARGTRRTDAQALAAWEQATRQRWRALALVIKAKLEAVEAGITIFEEEFLAHIVLPSGESVGAWMIPQMSQAYQTGSMPPMLPMET